MEFPLRSVLSVQARVRTLPISAACSQFLQDDIAKGSVHDNLCVGVYLCRITLCSPLGQRRIYYVIDTFMFVPQRWICNRVLREIERSSIQEYLWHNSRVTAGVFCTYCARDGNAVGDRPQLSFDDCLQFLDDLFPPQSESEEVVDQDRKTAGHEAQDSNHDNGNTTTKKSETIAPGGGAPVSVHLSHVDKIAMFLAAAGEADRAMALVQELRLVELASVESLNPTQRLALVCSCFFFLLCDVKCLECPCSCNFVWRWWIVQLEAENIARAKQLVFFEFEELLVGLAMIVTPHRRVVSTHAVEVLYDQPGGLRDLADKLARTYQMLHELPCVGIEGPHKGSRLHAILTRTSGLEVTTQTNDEAQTSEQREVEPCE